MKTRILTILFLSICFICGVFNVDAQPRPTKVYYRSIPATPPPPVKMVPSPRILSPIGHVYGFSLPGYNMLFNFCPNGRVYREGDKIGSPFTQHGNIITVYSNRVPQRVIGTGKISRDGRHIEWLEFSNGAKYRLRLIG